MADASRPVAALLPALEESAWEERAVRALARSPAARALEAAWAAAEGVELVVEPEAWEPEGVALVAPSVSLSAAPPLRPQTRRVGRWRAGSTRMPGDWWKTT